MKLRGLVEMFVSKDHGEPPYEGPRDLRGCRIVAWSMILFWLAVIAGVMYSCRADAAGYQVYLEDERDLGNGFKLCVYSEGVTITRPSHQLCPLSIEV